MSTRLFYLGSRPTLKYVILNN